MSDWNNAQYLKFEKQRTQPAKDLLARLRELTPQRIVDLGCGPGNSTNAVAEVFPQAQLVGIDSSPNMIQKANEKYPQLRFRLCDIWDLEEQYDLIFSNACLQWIPDHQALIPHLMSRLTDGGMLAFQIPMNGEEPLFQIIAEVAADPKWGLQQVELPPNETLTPAEYFSLGASCATSFDMWEVKYYHPLADHRALLDWVKGTRLRPYLDCLDAAQGAAFEEEILHRAKAFYPLQKNGDVLLGFRRFFFTAVK